MRNESRDSQQNIVQIDEKESENNALLSRQANDIIKENRKAIVDLQAINVESNQELTQIKELLVGVKSSIDNLNNTMIEMNKNNNNYNNNFNANYGQNLVVSAPPNPGNPPLRTGEV